MIKRAKFIKYWQVFITSLLSEIEYRMNFFLNILFSFIPFVTNILIWIAILKYKSNLMSYDIKDIILYYLVMFIIDKVTSINVMNEAQNDINTGKLSGYLIKPINYSIYKMLNFTSKTVLFLIFIFIPIIISGILLHNYFNLQFRIINFIWSVLILLIGFFINYYINFIISSLSFFFSQINSLFSAFDILKDLITGKVFPLDLMPKIVFSIISFSPFPFLGYYPTSIFLNRIPAGEIYSIFTIGIIWLLFLAFLKNITWRIGLRRYSAFGG